MDTQRPNTRNHKPNKWLAALMGFFYPTLSQLYVAQPTWAAVYFAAFWTISVGLAASHVSVLVKLIATFAVGVVCAVQVFHTAARCPGDRPRPRYSKWFGVLGILMLSLFPVAIVTRVFFFEPYTMPSGSMLPTLPQHDYFVVQKWGYGHYSLTDAPLVRVRITAPLHRGDIIVFDSPEDPQSTFAKRLIALPGDRLVYRDDKTLLINGHEVLQQSQGDYAMPSRGASESHYSRFRESLDGKTYSILLIKESSWLYQQDAPLSHGGCIYSKHALNCTVPQGQYFVMGDNRDNSRDSRYFGFVPAENIVGKVAYVF